MSKKSKKFSSRLPGVGFSKLAPRNFPPVSLPRRFPSVNLPCHIIIAGDIEQKVYSGIPRDFPEAFYDDDEGDYETCREDREDRDYIEKEIDRLLSLNLSIDDFNKYFSDIGFSLSVVSGQSSSYGDCLVCILRNKHKPSDVHLSEFLNSIIPRDIFEEVCYW